MENKTFLDLVEKYTINIPMMQRDYAQGRSEEEEKRDEFLNSIFTSLIDNKTLNLDFIYGKIDSTIFYPIDGQQRLTTLFLLYWYISGRENVVSEEIKQKLKKFVYDTRISSREFCAALIEKSIDMTSKEENCNLSCEIEDSSWFRINWLKDPTIKAMLIMIQAIHKKYTEAQSKDSTLKLWERLNKITFYQLDLEKNRFKLTDELYIKMNARGKQLTVFENFKALFIDFLSKEHKENKYGDQSYVDYFSSRIEKEWADLFWVFRNDLTEDNTFDDELMNVFKYIAQMCYFRKEKDKTVDDFKPDKFKQYRIIFKDEENINFLFNTLNKLHTISCGNDSIPKKEGLQSFFGLLFQVNDVNSNPGYNDRKVKLFWNTEKDYKKYGDSINLFERVIKQGIGDDVRNKIIFYCLLHFLEKHRLEEVNDDLKSYIRVVRNLLNAVRQRNETKYNTNVRVNNFADYWQLLDELSVTNIYKYLSNYEIDEGKPKSIWVGLENEKDKANIFNKNNNEIIDAILQLEDYRYFQGLISLIEPSNNIDKLVDYSIAIKEIWDEGLDDSLKIRALIVSGFKGVKIKNSKLGSLKYFGKKGNWSLILVNGLIEKHEKVYEEVSKNVISLLDSYLKLKNEEKKKSPEQLLNMIVQKGLKDYDRSSWQYYFLTYNQFIKDKHYYACKNDFEIRILTSDSSNPLLGKNVNPYVLTVSEEIDEKYKCKKNDIYQQYSKPHPLVLENGIKLTSTKDGWVISWSENFAEKIRNKYSEKITDNENNNSWFLKEKEGKDRVETAVNFINEVCK